MRSEFVMETGFLSQHPPCKCEVLYSNILFNPKIQLKRLYQVKKQKTNLTCFLIRAGFVCRLDWMYGSPEGPLRKRFSGEPVC